MDNEQFSVMSLESGSYYNSNNLTIRIHKNILSEKIKIAEVRNLYYG